MKDCTDSPLRYKRSRFTARLPQDRLYTPSHSWVKETAPGTFRIGLTPFAQRMLGDVVEFGFEAKPGQAVEFGRIVGWIEAFKAVTDLYSVIEGAFVQANPRLENEPQLIDHDPHGEGWLYEASGWVDPSAVDAAGYAAILDAHIDRMLGEEEKSDA